MLCSLNVTGVVHNWDTKFEIEKFIWQTFCIQSPPKCTPVSWRYLKSFLFSEHPMQILLRCCEDFWKASVSGEPTHSTVLVYILSSSDNLSAQNSVDGLYILAVDEKIIEDRIQRPCDLTCDMTRFQCRSNLTVYCANYCRQVLSLYNNH